MELKEFLKNNLIKLIFNREDLDKIFGEKLSNDFFGKWLFFSIENHRFFRANELELLNLKIENQDFDLNSIHKELCYIYDQWKIIAPLIPFPNISIENTDSSMILLDYDNPHIIIDFLDLKSTNKFKYTLGHELGHLYYYFMHNKDFANSNEFKGLRKKFFPFEYLLMSVINLFLLTSSFCSNNSNLEKSIVAFCLFISLTLFISTYSSIEKRIINFSREYFSDFFSVFLNKNIDISNILSKQKHNNHLYSHPSNNFRLDHIKKYIEEESILIESWKNPLVDNIKGHRMPDLFEIYLHLKNTLKRRKK